MLLSCLISLTLLHRSYGVQDGFSHLETYHWSGRGAGFSEGQHQHISFPQFQGLSPPHISRNQDPDSESHLGHASDHTQQPTTSSYAFPYFAPQWPNAGPSTPTHLPTDAPQGPSPHLLGYPSTVPQPPASYSYSSSNDALDWATEAESRSISESLASHIGPSQSQADTLEWIGKYLLEDDELPLAPTTDLPGQVSVNNAAAPHYPDFTSLPPRTEYLRELPGGLNGGGDISRQTQAPSSSLSATDEFDAAVPYSQPSDRIQEVPMVGSVRVRELRPGELPPHRQLEKKFNILRSTPVASVNFPKTVSQTVSPSQGALPKISKADSELERIRLDVLRRRFTPGARRHALTEYVPILRSATRLNHHARNIVLYKSVAKWLPVYTTTFKPERQCSQMEAKLATLFENLWLINTWLLHSFHTDNIERNNYDRGQDDMMDWVVNELLGRLPELTVYKPSQQEFGQLQRDVTNFLIAPRNKEKISSFARKRKHPVKVETEKVLACESAVYILEAYYQSNNLKRYQEAFDIHEGIFERLCRFTQTSINGNLKQWRRHLKEGESKLLEAPWSGNPYQKIQDGLWNKQLQQQLQHICFTQIKDSGDEYEKETNLKYVERKKQKTATE